MSTVNENGPSVPWWQQGAAPMATSYQTQQTGMPDWYNDYIKGIAGKGVELAGQAQAQGAPQQSIAGLTPDQQQAFQQVRNNQGSWQPLTQGAGQAFQGAQTAVQGPAQSFTDAGTQQKYMSPYTSSVVNEIARLGNQNFNENIMPQINNSMIGAGQFGSTRNAGALAQGARDVQANISGQQASALESGYTTAGNLFNQDANRQQQQQQLQAQTGLAAGQGMGALAQTQAGLGLQDAQALQAVGQQQQQHQQQGLDTDYNNMIARQQYGWNNLNNLNSIVRGAQLPTSQTASTQSPLSRTNNPSPLQLIGNTYAQMGGG
jgi:hypothetical protein